MTEVIPMLEKATLFKQKLSDYEQEIQNTIQLLADDKPLSNDFYKYLYSKATAVVYLAHDLLSEKSDLPKDEKLYLAKLMKDKILPYVLQTGTASRFCTKPLGYAGDYLTLENIYRNVETGSTPIGIVVDRMHLDAPTSIVVRNRRKLIGDKLYELFEKQQPTADEPMTMLCIASGSAREVYDLYETIYNQNDLKINALKTILLDFDKEALGFCGNWRDEKGWTEPISLVQETILNLIIGRSKVQILPQDVVYSIGLIDYFQEKHVIKLLNFIYSILKPNGTVILGNFHSKNIYKEYLDEVVDWKLIHRTEADMQRMFMASKFQKTGTIFFEGEGLNMFIQVHK
jgi:extracellular factor (EF) 3-hydroxypalmitic acid methyl ester biosynthesis protein